MMENIIKRRRKIKKLNYKKNPNIMKVFINFYTSWKKINTINEKKFYESNLFSFSFYLFILDKLVYATQKAMLCLEWSLKWWQGIPSSPEIEKSTKMLSRKC